MTRWPDGEPVTPWADPWHDVLGDIRQFKHDAEAHRDDPTWPDTGEQEHTMNDNTTYDSAILTDPTTGRIFEVAIETITPDTAKRYLGTSSGNRGIRVYAVRNRYVPDMANGEWKLNGETIIFDEEGHLRAGHHRLNACIEADAPFTTFIIRGTEAEAAGTNDSGVPWRAADHLGVDGEVQARQLCSVVRAYINYQRGGRYIGGGSSSVSNTQIYEVLRGPHGDMMRAAVQAMTPFHSKKNSILLRTGILGLMWVLFTQKDAHAAHDFFEKIRYGYGLTPGDPELAVRERLTHARIANEEVPNYDYGYMLITAWNARRTGRRFARSISPKNTDGPWPVIR